MRDVSVVGLGEGGIGLVMRMRGQELGRLSLAAVLGTLFFCGGGPALGQESTSQLLSEEEVKAAMGQAAAQDGLTEEVRAQVEADYQSTLVQLAAAAESRASTVALAESLKVAPGRAEDLEEKAAAIKAPVEPGSLISAEERGMDSNPLRDLLRREEARWSGLKNDWDALSARGAATYGRSLEVLEEGASVQKALTEAERELSRVDANGDWLQKAKRAQLQASKIAAQAKLQELEQVRLSAPAITRLIKAEQVILRHELDLAEVRVGELRRLVRAQVNEVAEAALAAVAEGRAANSVDEAEAVEIEGFARDLQSASKDLAAAERSLAAMRGKLETLKEDYQLAVEQIAASEGRGALAQALLDQRRALPDPQLVRQQMRRTGEQVSDVRLARFTVDRELSGTLAPGDDALEQARFGVLTELSGRYAALMQNYGELEVVKREYLSTLEEFDRLFKEKLFWVRSSPPVGADTLRDFPAGIKWLFGRGRGVELLKGFKVTLNRNSFQLGALALLAIALLFARPRFRRRMTEHLVEIRGVTSDGYRYTLEAMGFTLLISVPLSLLMWALGRQLLYDPDASAWIQGVGRGIVAMAPVLFGFVFVRELCRPEGVVETHFRWKKPALAAVRRGVSWIGVLYVPAGFLLVMLFSEKGGQHVHSVGRVLFMLTMLWVAYWVSVLLHPRTGVPSGEVNRQPGSWFARLKFLWYPLAVLMPIGLAVLAAFGYLVTALTLNGYLQASVELVVGAILLYLLLLRWFTIRERKLALEKRLAERKAKREAAENSGELIAAGEEGGMIGEDDTVDFVQVGMQTRRLLLALIVAGTAAALWFVWADAVPALRSLDVAPVIGQATWADLFLAILVAIATVVVAKNLPGILEIAVLQNLPIDSGSRYAAASLAQYIIVAIGGLLVFQILPLDWSQLGWAFAALSVGLGFGLQEIVANFVCGIILLFERPIRVGDVVTVSDVTGTVSKIRMRATTITDWDRKEFVVPNKEFITGQLLNWTLSNTTNRIVINIGVAYGSDIVKVQKVLMEVLGSHSDLMNDPGPVVTFGNFGDSSLDFTVRCYLPNLDRRLAVTHELYSDIYRRFEEEKIEIPFPQRDLHLRSDASKSE